MNPASLLSTYLRLGPDSCIEELAADGFWARLRHTADVHQDSTLLFITAGEGTQTRPRTKP